MGTVDTNELTTTAKKHGFTVKDLASMLGITVSSFYRKMKNGGAGFTIEDADTICAGCKFDVAEAMRIFFPRYVA